MSQDAHRAGDFQVAMLILKLVLIKSLEQLRKGQVPAPRNHPQPLPPTAALLRLRSPEERPKDLLEFPLVKNGIDPVRLTQISPNGNLAQLVEQRTLNP